MASATKISQQTYDETLLENQDLFELTPEQAITETISQFEQQGVTNLSSYLVTSHPESHDGMEERKIRTEFTEYLNVLDEAVQTDGTIHFNDESESESKSDEGGISSEGIWKALDGIQNCCSGRSTTTKSSTDDTMEQKDKDINVPKETAEETTTDSATATTSSTKKKTKSNAAHKRSEAFLTMLHSSNSIYTLMSLLSVVPLPSPTNDNEQQQQFAPTKKREKILSKVLETFISILTPRNTSERNIKALIKDTFVAFERVVTLIFFYIQHSFENKDGNEEELTSKIDILTNVIRLATVSCRNSEKNKVSFIRAMIHKRSYLESITGKKYGRSTIAIIIQCLLSSYDQYNGLNAATTTRGALVTLMTEVCKLVTITCRYDDFRPDGANSAGLNVGGIDTGTNVSSSHDHVMEFNREGVVPILHKVTLMALNIDVNDNNGDDVVLSEGEMVSLAGAALSATRVLAVNDEIVQTMVAVGTLRTIKKALDLGVKEILDSETVHNGDGDKNEKLKAQRQLLTVGGIGLVRNLCGNDEIKTTLCLGVSSTTSPTTTSTTTPQDSDKASILPSILHGMKLYRTNAQIQEHGCGALAAMALRRPTNAMYIVQEGGATEILLAMRQFPGNVLVQRQGALAVRNIVSRLVDTSPDADYGPSSNSSNSATEPSATNNSDGKKDSSTNDEINVRDVFLDLGAEVVLRGIAGRHQGSVDEAYAALRDLGCEVSMVKYNPKTGKTESRVEMFGEVKSNFRPVYENNNNDGDGVKERMAAHIAQC